MPQVLSSQQIATFHRDGFVIVKELFDQEEMDVLCRSANTVNHQRPAFEWPDGQDGSIKLLLLNRDEDHGACSFVSRLPRIVDSMELLLAAEVFHDHSKISIKDPLVGGAWDWHQDYGYWYHNGCLYPDMASVFIAIDPNTRENGCMQLLRGSHKMGRLDHRRDGHKTGADPDRVGMALERMETVYCELNSGDALYFHANALHRSDQNKSPHTRASLICCYNTRHNSPYKASPNAFYEPLARVADSRLKDMYGKR